MNAVKERLLKSKNLEAPIAIVPRAVDTSSVLGATKQRKIMNKKECTVCKGKGSICEAACLKHLRIINSDMCKWCESSKNCNECNGTGFLHDNESKLPNLQ